MKTTRLIQLILGIALITLSLTLLVALTTSAYQSVAQEHVRQDAGWLDTYLHVRMLSSSAKGLMDGCRESQEIVTHHYPNGVIYFRCEGR